jgi:hypothetical protein
MDNARLWRLDEVSGSLFGPEQADLDVPSAA